MWRISPHGHGDLLRIGLWAVLLLFAASASRATPAVFFKRARGGHILAIVLIGMNLFSDLVNTVLNIEPRAILRVAARMALMNKLREQRMTERSSSSWTVPATG